LAELPDLILMDLVMPEMDGFEMLRRIKQIPEIQDIPVIAVSAGVFDHQRQECVKAGCNDFIPKPIDADAVLNILKKHLRLEWIYEIPKEKVKQTQRDKIVEGPPPEFADELYELAIIGDIEGVIEKAIELKGMGKKYLPFATQLQELAEEFQTNQLPLMIKPYLSEKRKNAQ